MLLISLLYTPVLGAMTILLGKDRGFSVENIKYLGLTTSVINMCLALIIFILFDFSTNLFQLLKENYNISYFNFKLGVDGISIYFVLLTTIIAPISLISN
jgi:NADH:ubiquinone oxidoreductase subunit 4 (subunit M)